jgi:hypothetical protein
VLNKCKKGWYLKQCRENITPRSLLIYKVSQIAASVIGFLKKFGVAVVPDKLGEILAAFECLEIL